VIFRLGLPVSVYVLVAIVRKRMGLEMSLYPNPTDFQYHPAGENSHFMRA
jgi:hypothetical protein